MIIENFVSYAKPLINLYKYPEAKKALMYENERDLVLGFIIGGIQPTFKDSFKVSYGRQLKSEEEEELVRITLDRITRIKSSCNVSYGIA